MLFKSLFSSTSFFYLKSLVLLTLARDRRIQSFKYSDLILPSENCSVASRHGRRITDWKTENELQNFSFCLPPNSNKSKARYEKDHFKGDLYNFIIKVFNIQSILKNWTTTREGEQIAKRSKHQKTFFCRKMERKGSNRAKGRCTEPVWTQCDHFGNILKIFGHFSSLNSIWNHIEPAFENVFFIL